MMNLTRKQIVERARSLIRYAEQGGASNSFLAQWHRENASVLRELLAAYISLDVLEQGSLEQTGMSLAQLLGIPTDRTEEEAMR